MDKTELRKAMLRKTARELNVDQPGFNHEQAHLLAKLIKELRLRKPTCVGLFYPLVNEINLNGIFADIKAITAYPKVSDNTLTFHAITALDELRPISPYGLCEPAATAELVVPDLIIVPGVAFSKNGQRLGRGKGHYDRYLSANATFTISLAFSWQLFESIPTQAHDIKIDAVFWS